MKAVDRSSLSTAFFEPRPLCGRGGERRTLKRATKEQCGGVHEFAAVAETNEIEKPKSCKIQPLNSGSVPRHPTPCKKAKK